MSYLRFSGLLALSLLFSISGLSAQTTYYVSPAGDNSAAGTSLDSAWKTLEYGLAAIAPGDTLLVDDGLYVETELRIRQVSTADRPTVVKLINQWVPGSRALPSTPPFCRRRC